MPPTTSAIASPEKIGQVQSASKKKRVAAAAGRACDALAEGAGTMDIGLTQLPSFNARSCLNAGTYGTMGVGLGQAIAAAVAEPNRPVIHLSGDSAIGFSGMEMETLVRYNLPVKIVVLNNGGIGPGMPEIPENPMFNMKPNSLIYGARYDRMMEAFGGKASLSRTRRTSAARSTKR